MPEMMRAVGFTEFGDPSVLHIVTVPKPSPGPEIGRASCRERVLMPV